MPRRNTYSIAAALALAWLLLLFGCGEEKSKPTTTTTTPPDAAVTASVTDAAAPSATPDASVDVPVPPSASPDGSASGTPDTPLTTTGKVTPPPTPPKPTTEPSASPPPTASAPTAQPTASTKPPPKPIPTQVGPAPPGSADAVAEKVDAIYKPIRLFRARFKQKYTAKIAGKTKRSEGWATVKRPRRLSFRYKPPNKNRVVSDGKTIQIYEHENQQMFVGNMAGTDYPGALAFIMGNGLRPNFTFKFHKTAKWEGGPVLIGTPRVPNPGYKTVLFYIDEALLEKGDPACVRRVLVIDAQSNRNRFDFLDIEQPATIPDSEFVFKAPKGTEILK